MPSDTFSERYNLVAVSEMVSRLKVVEIVPSAGSDKLLIAAQGKVYEEVDEEDTAKRVADLKAEPFGTVSCVMPGHVVEASGYPEEAKVRQLHLGLGRTSIKSAIESPDSVSFGKSIDDLIEIFRFINLQVHTSKEIQSTNQVGDRNDLFASLAARSKHFEPITVMRAKTITTMLGKGILPVRNKRTNLLDSWSIVHGHKLERGLRPDKPKSASKIFKSKGRKNQQPKVSVRLAPFLSLIEIEGQPVPIEDRFIYIHDQYVNEGRPFAPKSQYEWVTTLRSGIVAYLEDVAKESEPIVAGEFESYLGRVAPATFMKRMGVVGNVLALQINRGGLRYKPEHTWEVPGLKEVDLAYVFKLIRLVASSRHQESPRATKIAELVEAYLSSAPSEPQAS